MMQVHLACCRSCRRSLGWRSRIPLKNGSSFLSGFQASILLESIFLCINKFFTFLLLLQQLFGIVLSSFLRLSLQFLQDSIILLFCNCIFLHPSALLYLLKSSPMRKKYVLNELFYLTSQWKRLAFWRNSFLQCLPKLTHVSWLYKLKEGVRCWVFLKKRHVACYHQNQNLTATEKHVSYKLGLNFTLIFLWPTTYFYLSILIE